MVVQTTRRRRLVCLGRMTSEFPSVILGSNRIAPFNPIVLYSHSSNYLREKMPEEDEPPDHVSASDFRTTHVYFDIEDEGRPRREEFGTNLPGPKIGSHGPDDSSLGQKGSVPRSCFRIP